MAQEDVRKLLIVEDDSLLVQLYQRMFQSSGVSALIARTGEEALDRMKNYMPDLVLLDLRLPDIDGFEVIRRMRKDKELASIPVIMLSNYDDQEGKSKDLGVVGYFLKSHANPDELVEKVKQMIEIHGKK